MVSTIFRHFWQNKKHLVSTTFALPLTKIFKVKSGVAPERMTEIFKFKDHSYDLRKNNCMEKRIIKSCKYGSEIVSNLGAKLWDILPENI